MPTTHDIASLVPHAGEMVLIGEILDSDDTRIRCRSSISSPAEHPLAKGDRLPATALAEYGAQAMAVHGGLIAAAARSPVRRGLLGALNRLQLAVESISEPCELIIEAEQQLSGASGQIYAFTITRDSEILAHGQATVMFPEPECG